MFAATCNHKIVSQNVVGADKDKHSCVGSAGYTWSIVKSDCIRIFEAGTQLTAAEAVTDKTTAAYAVFSLDRKKAELFIPGEKASIIVELTTAKGSEWKKGIWQLIKIENKLSLTKSGIVQYMQK